MPPLMDSIPWVRCASGNVYVLLGFLAGNILLRILWTFFNFASPLMVSIVTGVGGSIVLGALMTTLPQKSWRSYTPAHRLELSCIMYIMYIFQTTLIQMLL